VNDEERPGEASSGETDPGTDPATTPVTDPTGTPETPETPGPSAIEGELTDVPDLDDLPGGARAALEAVLMVVQHPVEEVQLAAALDVTVERVTELLAGLVAEYDGDARGFELRRVAGGWRFYTRAEFSPVLARFVLDGQTSKLSQAALETLAIVAYRQPVSRARVSAVRGVNVDAVMRTLVTRGLVEDDGNDPETGATLYRTTQTFLHKLGLTSLDELPALAPFLPEVDALDDFPAGVA
jgi:segregation and condensation protein B